MAKIHFSFEADSVAEFNEMVSSLALMQQVEKNCCSSEKVEVMPNVYHELIAQKAQSIFNRELNGGSADELQSKVFAEAFNGDPTRVVTTNNPFNEQVEQIAAEIFSKAFSTEQTAKAAAEEEVKQRRKRRTKAEIEADNAREAAAATGVVAEVVATPEVVTDELVKVIAPIEPALEGEVLPALEVVQEDWVDQANQATGIPSFAPPPPSSTPNFNFGTITQPNQLNTIAQTPSALPQDLLAALSGMVLPK